MRSWWTALGWLVCAALIGTGCARQTRAAPASAPGAAASLAPQEGAHPLALQLFNGCALLANGAPVAKGGADIPYPAQCEGMDGQVAPPHARLELSSGVPYALEKLTLIDSRVNAHTQLGDPNAAAEWIRSESRFKSLDWTGLKIISDDWLPSSFPQDWRREVLYGGARWMERKDGAFLVELLNGKGQPVRSVRYPERAFFTTNPITSHTRLAWEINGAGASPGPDGGVVLRNPPDSPPLFHTLAKLEWARNVDPGVVLRLDGVEGDAALRVTWSRMTGAPFYFPVHVSPRESLPTSCFTQDGHPARCDFGLVPTLSIRPPRNGSFYQPGEETDFTFRAEDGSGHLLHPPDRLPSYAQYFAGEANGLLYFNDGPVLVVEDRDTIPAFKIAGPLQALGAGGDPSRPGAYTQIPEQEDGHLTVGELVSPALAGVPVPGFSRIQTPTRYPVRFPADAQAGTYVAFLKLNRAFFGERRSATAALTFQVGAVAPTRYPGDVGGCEACHTGPTSLEKLLHGFPGGQVQGCKVCHADIMLNLAFSIHRLHALSSAYGAPRGDCRVCHLTRAPALRASYQACSSCHQTLHGARYAEARFAISGHPNRFERCADACHEKTPPPGHRLPVP